MPGSDSTAKRAKRVTLADVASMAGVSVATASVAITGRPSGNCRVSAPVAEKIRRAALVLHYRPNLQARNLSMQRTQTVALIVKRSTWQNAMFYLSAAQRVLRQRGYSEIFLLPSSDDAASEREQLELCIDRRVEGIIIMPVIDLAGRTNVLRLDEILAVEKIPIVQLGIALDGCAAPSVTSDEAAAMRLAVQALHERGHRRIGHVTMAGAKDAGASNPFRTAYLRRAGYEAAMKELGLEPQVFAPAENRTTVPELYDSALEQCPSIAAANPRPTAMTTYSDYTAAGVVAGLTDLGLKPPRDMEIIGYGDQPFGRMMRPTLSTLAPQYEEIGATATQILLAMIEGKTPGSVALPPKLVLRQSAAEK